MATMGLLFALRERALKLPQEVSFVGIDDLDFAAILNPRPTVVAMSSLDMARRSIEVLIAQVESGGPPTGKARGLASEAGAAGAGRAPRRPGVKQRSFASLS